MVADELEIVDFSITPSIFRGKARMNSGINKNLILRTHFASLTIYKTVCQTATKQAHNRHLVAVVITAVGSYFLPPARLSTFVFTNCLSLDAAANSVSNSPASTAFNTVVIVLGKSASEPTSIAAIPLAMGSSLAP